MSADLLRNASAGLGLGMLAAGLWLEAGVWLALTVLGTLFLIAAIAGTLLRAG